MTRTCTFSVSPGRKSGTSLRSDAASRVSRVFIVASFSSVSRRQRRWRAAGCGSPRVGAPATAAGNPSMMPHRGPASRENGRSAARARLELASRSGRRCRVRSRSCSRAPARDLARGRRTAAPRAPPGPRHDGRLGVGRRLEQAVRPGGERVVDGATAALPSTPGQQPGDRLDDHQHGHLAAGQHVVAEADLVDRHPAARRTRAPARRCPRTGRRRTPATARAASSAATRLGERPPGRRRARPAAAAAGRRRRELVQRPPPRLGQHHHARAAAVRGVVDGAVDVVGPAPQVVHARARSARARSALPSSDCRSGAR